MKVLRGFSILIIGMWLVSCAEQYTADERFVAEKGVNRAQSQDPGQNSGSLNGGNGNILYPGDDCVEPSPVVDGATDPCEPIEPPKWQPPEYYPPTDPGYPPPTYPPAGPAYPPIIDGPIYPPISYPPPGVIPPIFGLPPVVLPPAVAEVPPAPGIATPPPAGPIGVPAPEICAYKCTGLFGEGAGMDPMYASIDPYTGEFVNKADIWQKHEGGEGKLVCLDLYSINGKWKGDQLVDWDPQGGDLYSYNPADNCVRSPLPIGKRGPEGCFVPETKILMANGLEKRISDIKAGELVWNPATKKTVRVESLVKGPEKHDLYVLGFAGKTVTVTRKHPFVTKSGAKQARHLTKDDMVQDSKGNFHKLEVLKTKKAEKGQIVWNLVINGDSADENAHLIVADGIASGDLKLQKDLAKKLKAKDSLAKLK